MCSIKNKLIIFSLNMAFFIHWKIVNYMGYIIYVDLNYIYVNRIRKIMFLAQLSAKIINIILTLKSEYAIWNSITS